ncbi:MAG: hypothetical protein HY515_02365 [Candidatus Aenigmarchaeota archaeon]|nr:hypothetical protein [Candidatus Aenigmarchaeota archaeon]
MATFDFIGLQNSLKAMGFYDFVMPWLLAFSVTFGILQTVNIFKKGTANAPNTSVDAVISMVAAFYLTLFTPYSGFLSSFFSKLFGGGIIVLSGVLVLLMFVGIFGLRMDSFFFEGEGASRKIKGITYFMLIAAFIVAAGLFYNANLGTFPLGDLSISNSGEILTALVFFGIIFAVIWFVVHEGKGAGNEEAAAAPAAGAPRR